MFAFVAEGDLVFIYGDDCVERPYNQGEAFVDPGLVHTATTPATPTRPWWSPPCSALPRGAAPATPVAPDEAAALNEACGINAPVPQPAGRAHEH